jgi:hypothetical protein
MPNTQRSTPDTALISQITNEAVLLSAAFFLDLSSCSLHSAKNFAVILHLEKFQPLLPGISATINEELDLT